MTEAIAGYVRSGVIHRIASSGIAVNPDHPTLRLLQLTTDDGEVRILLDADSAQALADQLSAAVAELRRVERSERHRNFGPH